VVKSVTVLRLTAADEVTATETGVEVDSTTEDVVVTALDTTARVELETCSTVVVVFSTSDTEVVVA